MFRIMKILGNFRKSREIENSLKKFLKVFQEMKVYFFKLCSQPTLLSIISGDALPIYHSLSNAEVVKCALSTLRSNFKQVEVPEPTDFFATRWGSEEFSQMSYSYVKIGASGSDYDVMALPHS